jgi:prolyl-tRNA synthetase
VKFADAELLGVPTIVIVGRGLADGVVEVWDRASGERAPVPARDVVDSLAATLEEAAGTGPAGSALIP